MIRTIPPHADKFIEIPDQIREMIGTVSEDIYTVSIEFTDTAGNHWQRDPYGALTDL